LDLDGTPGAVVFGPFLMAMPGATPGTILFGIHGGGGMPGVLPGGGTPGPGMPDGDGIPGAIHTGARRTATGDLYILYPMNPQAGVWFEVPGL